MTRLRPGWRAVVVACLAAIVVAWVLIVPPGAGADEPSHLIRSAAVIRGQTSGTPDPAATGTNRGEFFTVPARVQVPQPGCYAFVPQVAVTCAAPVAITEGELELVSTSDEYPLWGHLTYGIGTLIPGIDSVWPVRLIGASIAIALIGAALMQTPSITGRAGILLASTPTAVATIATVNPSAFAVAGAIGCWVALLRPNHHRITTSESWWFAASWAALILTRRDGIAWASIIVAVASLYRSRYSIGWLARLRPSAATVVVITTLIMVIWGLTGGSRLSQLASLSPLLIIAADAARSIWRYAPSRRARTVFVIGSAVIAVLVGSAALARRPGGWDPELARTVWTFADDHLVQAVGVFGWLDTWIPGLAVGGFMVTIGTLFGAALVSQPRTAGWGFAAGAVAVVTAWWLEMLSGSNTGQYWQGRYSLPLLVGVPLVLSTIKLDAAKDRRVGLTVAGVALILLNIGAWAGARRWGVGVEGPLVPSSWDTFHQPVAPVVPLVVMATVSVLLVIGLSRSDAPPTPS